MIRHDCIKQTQIRRELRRINQPATKGRPAGDETKAENETRRSMSTSALELKRIFSQSDAGSRKNLLGASAWKRSHIINVRLPETERGLQFLRFD